jgi:hypothetical protein
MMHIVVIVSLCVAGLLLLGIGLVILAWFITKDDEMLHHWEQMQGSLDDE